MLFLFPAPFFPSSAHSRWGLQIDDHALLAAAVQGKPVAGKAGHQKLSCGHYIRTLEQHAEVLKIKIAIFFFPRFLCLVCLLTLFWLCLRTVPAMRPAWSPRQRVGP
jgi:hypothetical protein